MGASDSKLVFKQGIFKLSEQPDIPADDPYWRGFWELPETAEDVLSLLSPTDVRRVRDTSLANLETLVLALTSRLFALRHSPEFPNNDTAPELEALNCIRVLTRLLPILYESETLEKWEQSFFWSARRVRKSRASQHVLFDDASTTDNTQVEQPDEEFEEAKPLAHELIDTLVDLLFFTDFTLPMAPSVSSKVRLSIWQSGVGCNTSVGSSKEIESNRTEVLRLLLTLASKSMYTSQSLLPVQGVQAITYMTTITDKHLVLTVLCSLLNTALKYNPATWHVPYDHVVFRDSKELLVTYCLQLLLVLVLYPVPEREDGTAPRNSFRHFLGKLHRPQDFQFLVDGMTRILSHPVNGGGLSLPGSQKTAVFAPEMVMLFWELLQCNKRFRSFVIDTDRSHDFVVLILYHATSFKQDPSRQGIVRMCIFVLQTLSTEPNFGPRLNKAFSGQESLPAIVKIPDFKGSYTDFLFQTVIKLITTGKGRLEAVYPALFAILNNVAPHATELSQATSASLVQLFGVMTSPDYLLANESNHSLLQSLLEVLNAIIENQFEKNAMLVLALLRSRKRVFALKELKDTRGAGLLSSHAQHRKELLEDSRRASVANETLRSPVSARAPSLSDVPEDTFTIGDDEDEYDDDQDESHIRPSSSLQSQDQEDVVPSQMRGMSEKQRGKMPASSGTARPGFSRTNSTTSLASVSQSLMMPSGGSFEPTEAWLLPWLDSLPVQTLLQTVDQVAPLLPPSSATSTEAVRIIQRMRLQNVDAAPVRVHLFEWSPLSIGWYESLLWSMVYMGELAQNKGGPGVWRGSLVRLFRVQETAPPGPTLASPRGAVDAVGSNLVQRLNGLSFASGNNSPRSPTYSSRDV